MKLRDLERHLRTHGATVVREGANHTIWASAAHERRAPVPRHRDIGGNVARAICRQLGIPDPRR